MTSERLQKVQQVLSQRQPDLTVLLDGVHKSHNVAAILRSCDAVGVMDVHMARPRCGFSRHHMTSGGTQKWMRHHHYDTVAEAVQALKGKGFKVVAAHKSGSAIPYQQWDYTQPTAVMMGAELYGVDREVLEQVDAQVYIPMVGMVESFNVSVACAILLSEARRQRHDAGCYRQPRIPGDEMSRLSFEWLHPEFARHCRESGKPYPPMDEDGDIITGQ